MNALLLIADSSTLLNFLKVKRFDLVEALGLRVLVVDAVYEEIKSEREQLEQLVADGVLGIYKTEDPAFLETASDLVGLGLGSGESFSIAAAVECGAKVAIDDRRAMALAREAHETIECVTTVDIVVAALAIGCLTIAEADELKAEWATEHRFVLKFDSFSKKVGLR